MVTTQAIELCDFWISGWWFRKAAVWRYIGDLIYFFWTRYGIKWFKSCGLTFLQEMFPQSTAKHDVCFFLHSVYNVYRIRRETSWDIRTKPSYREIRDLRVRDIERWLYISKPKVIGYTPQTIVKSQLRRRLWLHYFLRRL